MNGKTNIRDARLFVESLAQRFDLVFDGQEDGWQREYIALRRSMHDALASLRATMRGVAGTDDALLRRIDDSHARVRHKLTLHQARWPAISLDKACPEYQQSRREILDAYAVLGQVIDEMLTAAD